jgi:hypothetical protein
VENGLYLAKERLFNSWFFLAGGYFPLPGARLTLWICFIILLCSSLFRFIYNWSRAGQLLTHLGMFILLFGAAYTLHFSQESFLTLQEGQGLNVSTDYHKWELSTWTQKRAGDTLSRQVEARDFTTFKKGKSLAFPESGFSLEVTDRYLNCGPGKNEQPDSISGTILSVSGLRSLVPEPYHADPAKNIPGLSLKLKKTDGSASELETLLLYGGDGKPVSFTVKKQRIFASLRRKRHVLPLLVKLIDFKKLDHPGTKMARSYESRVLIRTSGLERETVISMNKPLRHEEFTFYQSSFSQTRQGESSTFSVVRNSGRLLPYVASLVISLGMLIHFTWIMFRFAARTRRRDD